MAFWQKKRGKQVVVYVWDAGNRRQKQLPRDVTRHLDTEPEHNIEAWVAEWERRNGEAVAEKRPTDPRLQVLIEAYSKYLRSRKKSEKTILDHRHHLDVDAIAYFVGLHGLIDPNEWPRVGAKLSAWMREQGRSEFQIQKANSAVRGFWRWLGDEREILTGIDLRLRAPIREAQPTPLRHIPEPAAMLAFIRNAPRRDIKLMALFGYFFSLRPQETFELRPRDMRAGKDLTTELECCRVMKRYGLFDRLAVHVTRQKTQKDGVQAPKAHSKGWVACFSADAARLLVELLKECKPDERLFSFQNDWNYTLWRKHGFPEMTLKDLRRASIYHLGHRVDMKTQDLKAHARHAKEETTELYLRRPEEVIEGWTKLDLDA